MFEVFTLYLLSSKCYGQPDLWINFLVALMMFSKHTYHVVNSGVIFHHIVALYFTNHSSLIQNELPLGAKLVSQNRKCLARTQYHIVIDHILSSKLN